MSLWWSCVKTQYPGLEGTISTINNLEMYTLTLTLRIYRDMRNANFCVIRLDIIILADPRKFCCLNHALIYFTLD